MRVVIVFLEGTDFLVSTLVLVGTSLRSVENSAIVPTPPAADDR